MSRYLLFVIVALSACRPPESDAGLDAGAETDAGPDYPDPRTDLVPPVGSDSTLDIATWNIENYPATPSTPAVVADLIASMDLDLVAVQEIASVEAFDELVARLPDHEGVLSTHAYSNGTYQKVGFIYRADRLTLSEPTLLFADMGYEFPRPPLQVVATAGDLDFVLVTLHLKAGRDFEDRDRREAAMIALADHLAAAGDPDVIALGDFNEVVTTGDGLAVFDPFLADPSGWQLHTEALAADGKFSFVPGQVILDHVLTSPSLADELTAPQQVIPPLHVQLVNYESGVSDHLPVVVSAPIF